VRGGEPGECEDLEFPEFGDDGLVPPEALFEPAVFSLEP
jgi:hypothetical protein